MTERVPSLLELRVVRAYKFVMHLTTDWTVEKLRKGLLKKSIKGWVWIRHDQDTGTDHVHLILWSVKELDAATLGRWFEIPATQVERVRGGKAGVVDELLYMLHVDPSAASLGKTPYPDSALHASPGFDPRGFLTVMLERRAQAGSPRQRGRNLDQRVSEGLPLREALKAGGSTETRLRRARARFLLSQLPPSTRVTYLIHGSDRRQVDAVALALVVTLAGGRNYAHFAGQDFAHYDGERVIAWLQGDPLLALVQSLGRDLHAALCPLPTQTRVRTPLGETQLLHDSAVLATLEPFGAFRRSLERIYGSTSDDARRDSATDLPVVVHVRGAEIEVRISRAFLEGGPCDEYAVVGKYRSNLLQVLHHARSLTEDRRTEVESEAQRRLAAPIIAAGDRVRRAACPEVDETSIEQMLAQVGNPLDDRNGLGAVHG